MNYLTYQFSSTENENTPYLQILNAEVSFNRTPTEDESEKIYFRTWIDCSQEPDAFNEETAIALRDFLNFCFPPKCN